MSGLGPSFTKIWTCGSSPRSGSRNAWTRFKNFNGVSRLNNFWNFFGAIQVISCRGRLVTMDKTWLYHYDPETKQQSLEWKHSGSHHPKVFRVQKFAGKFLAPNFGIKTASSALIIFQRVQTINVEYYSSLLVQLKDILKEKLGGKFTKGVLFLHDNAPAHQAPATQKEVAYLGFQCLDHPLYSPETWLDGQPSDFFFEWLEKVRATG